MQGNRSALLEAQTTGSYHITPNLTLIADGTKLGKSDINRILNKAQRQGLAIQSIWYVTVFGMVKIRNLPLVAHDLVIDGINALFKATKRAEGKAQLEIIGDFQARMIESMITWMGNATELGQRLIFEVISRSEYPLEAEEKEVRNFLQRIWWGEQ